MEKIEGESLAAMRKRGAVLSEGEVVRLLRDASDVLDYLHHRAPPVIHRDLKPGNVLHRPDGSFAFVDFGAVRDKLRPEGGSTVVGTFGYMAPEQFQGRALPASDVYAIGATAISMLTGRQPEDLPHKGLAIDVRAALPGRNPRLVDALAAMLDPDPDRRPSRIEPVLSKLDQRAPDRAPEPRHRDRKRERRETRRAQRAARRRGRGRRPFVGPIALVFSLAFLVGMAAVWLATQVVVPAVLRILATFFAPRGLRAAADAVREAGAAALHGMHRSRRWVFAGAMGEAAERARADAQSATAGGTRVRVTGEVAEPRVRVDPPQGGNAEERAEEATETGADAARR